MGDVSKLQAIQHALNAKFFERENEVEAVLVALIARQHLLLFGPAGTAKSALAAELAKILKGARYFQWMLTKFSMPEEIFGPLSLKDLERGVYKRFTEHKMPEAHVVFLDEIFKANSAILNSLLTIVNERLFYNDRTPVKVPLMSVIGASNEYPEEGEGLDALFDRFLLRFTVEEIREETSFISMLKNEGQKVPVISLSIEELIHYQACAERVSISEEVYIALAKIRKELQDEGIRPSDRRFKQSLSILQARAMLRGRLGVILEDLSILEHALWETVDQKETVSFIIQRHAEDSLIQTLDSILNEATEIHRNVVRDRSAEAGMEATRKIKVLIDELNRLRNHHKGRLAEIDALLKRVKVMEQEILNYLVEPMYFDGLYSTNENGNASAYY